MLRGVRRAAASRWSRWSRRRRPPSAWPRSARRRAGFLYTVSVVGTTGERARARRRASPRSSRAPRPAPQVPVALGFGIGTPEQAAPGRRRGRRRRDRRHAPGARGGRGAATRRRRSARSSANWPRASRRLARIRAGMGLILTVTAGPGRLDRAVGARGQGLRRVPAVGRDHPRRRLAEDPLRLPARPPQLARRCARAGWAWPLSPSRCPRLCAVCGGVGVSDATEATGSQLTIYSSLPLQGPTARASQQIVNGEKLALARRRRARGRLQGQLRLARRREPDEREWSPGRDRDRTPRPPRRTRARSPTSATSTRARPPSRCR